MTTPTSHSLVVNGLRLRYLEWGTRGAPAMLCLHGFTEQAHVFDALGEALGSAHHVVALDWRGHGESAWAPDAGYSRDAYLADLTVFVDALGLRRFMLVGQSLGGIIGMLYAAQHAERLERVVLVDIAPETGPGAERQRTSRPPRPMRFATFDDALRWSCEGVWFSGPAEHVRQDLGNKLRQREDGAWVWRLDPALFQPAPLPADASERLWRGLAAFTCPVLEVRGTDSGFVSDDILARMKMANPRLTSTDVPRAAHIVPVDNRGGFVATVQEFFAAGARP